MSDSSAEDSSQLRDFDPVDYELLPSRPSFRPPCWGWLTLDFRPSSQRAKEATPLPWSMPFRVDLFSRFGLTAQLHERLLFLIDNLRPIWQEFLLERYARVLLPSVENLPPLQPFLFKAPTRADFESASLADVLRQQAEEFDVYLAEDRGAYGHKDEFLRIHSTVGRTASRRLWCDKPLGRNLQQQDVAKWFESLIHSLSKARQPRDPDGWLERLFVQEPHLRLENRVGGAWNELHPVVLVFGQTKRIGTAALYHLDRDRIRGVRRQGSEILIEATIANPYSAESDQQPWTFHFFTRSPLHAGRLEARLLSGESVHFGLDQDVVGLVALHQEYINAIGVSENELRKRFVPAEATLHRLSAPRFRHQTYAIGWPAAAAAAAPLA